MDTLASKIRQLRKQNGFTQEQLANILCEKYGMKVDRVMISKWETGFQTPQISTIKSLAEVFHVSLDYINGLSDYPEVKNIPFDNFISSMYRETKDMNEKDKQTLLDMAKVLKERYKK